MKTSKGDIQNHTAYYTLLLLTCEVLCTAEEVLQRVLEEKSQSEM